MAPETVEVEVPETPEISDEQVLAFLESKVGHPVVPADLERFANLDTMAREVMREKSELGRAKKAAPAAAPDDSVDLDSIDPTTRKMLDKLIEQTVTARFGASLSLPAIQAEEDVNSAIDEFMEAHDDITPEAVSTVIAELEAQGVRPAAPTKRATKAYLKTAYDIAKSRTLDMDAIKKAAKEEALLELAKEASEKGEVVAVEKKRGTSEKVDADVANVSLGFWERLGINA